MVKFCDKCGEELKNENARFCDKCGAEVKMGSNQNNAKTANIGGIVCPHCGQTTSMGLTHCEKCGSSFEDNRVAVIIGYIVSLIIPILGLIPAIYLLTRNNGKAKTQGVLIIGLIILSVILNLILRSWIVYLIIIILIVVGIYLWYNDFTLFD
ncbi:MAG: zinc-ribbon domain-containing protein [Methanobrevibacter sp.]|nr:zinc-ribbon domain-containing protein [Methanobrevibacter sp.]